MIIQCESCSRKFVVKDSDIPQEGRDVQCSYCSSIWHQMPSVVKNKIPKTKKLVTEKTESLSVDSIKASDGKTYKFLGSQWAQLLPSGKTGLFAKKKIGKELDKLTGRKIESSLEKRGKKIKKELDPSSGSLDNDKKQMPDIHKSKHGLGFFGYIFLLIIVGFSVVGILKTFENDLLNYFPEIEFVQALLRPQGHLNHALRVKWSFGRRH